MNQFLWREWRLLWLCGGVSVVWVWVWVLVVASVCLLVFVSLVFMKTMHSLQRCVHNTHTLT